MTVICLLYFLHKYDTALYTFLSTQYIKCILLTKVGAQSESTMADSKQVNQLAKQLRNVGPKLASKLIEAGIDSPDQLRKLGAKKAFSMMYATGDSYGDYNAAYLYALEGAIRNCDWLEIPEEIKQEYREYAQNLQGKKQ